MRVDNRSANDFLEQSISHRVNGNSIRIISQRSEDLGHRVQPASNTTRNPQPPAKQGVTGRADASTSPAGGGTPANTMPSSPGRVAEWSILTASANQVQVLAPVRSRPAAARQQVRAALRDVEFCPHAWRAWSSSKRMSGSSEAYRLPKRNLHRTNGRTAV